MTDELKKIDVQTTSDVPIHKVKKKIPWGFIVVPLVVVHDNYNTYGFKNYFQRLVRRKVGDFFFARKHADSIRAMRMEKKNYRVKKNYGILLKMLSEGRIDFFCFLIFISFLGILVNFYIRIGFMMNPV